MMVDGHINFFGMNKKHEYTGYIKFKDVSGKRFKHRFMLDAEMYRGSLYHDREELKTHYEIQRLPEELKKIQTELAKIEAALERKKSPRRAQ
jgi:hypothetical protein